MNRFLLILLLGVQLVCLGLIWISCFPGLILDSFFIILAIAYVMSIPFAIAIILAIILTLNRRKKEKQLPLQRINENKRDRRRLLIAFVVTIAITTILLKTNLPQTIAFSLSRPAFEAVVTHVDQLQKICNSKPIDQQLGFYRVIECDRDERGGIYFSTGQYGLFFDFIHYGFAYKPNPYGNAHFGSKIYGYYPIIGDWYGFKSGTTF